MAIVRRQGSINVVEAARQRVRNIFSHNLPVYLAFSGGKDSLCIGHIVLEEILQGNIDPKQLVVEFIDEEAIFPDVERVTKEWRQKFILAGAQFWWFCIEVRHHNAFNNLSADESFICFDRNKKDSWVRQPPPFAIRTHPKLKPRRDSYQEFLPRIEGDGITVMGVRAAESVQRLQYMAKRKQNPYGKMNPIFDWSDNDVWLYLKLNKIDFPIEYLYLWQVGVNKKQLRLSQFFSIDTCGVLVRMAEFYPDLMERVCKREPNAYIAALYWESELFRRIKSKQGEKDDTDYKAKALHLLSNIEANFRGHAKYIAYQYQAEVIQHSCYYHDGLWRRLYAALIAGDPKGRTLRAIATTALSSKKSEEQAEEKAKVKNGNN